VDAWLLAAGSGVPGVAVVAAPDDGSDCPVCIDGTP